MNINVRTGLRIKIRNSIGYLNKIQKEIDNLHTIHSIMTVPIVGISYKVKKQTTICRIKWINPATGNTKVTCGIATCNPDDKFDKQIGQRLSESRAKIIMYNEYMQFLSNIYTNCMNKYSHLIQKEAEHQRRIKPSKENNM